MFDIKKLTESGYTLYESPAPVFRGEKNRTDKLPFIHITNPSGKQAVVPHRPDVGISFASAGVHTTSDEIYQAYYGLDDEEMCYFRNGYGSKSESWFKEKSKEIGLVLHKDHVDIMKNEIQTEKDADEIIEMIYSRVAIAKRGEMWLAEWIEPLIEDADVAQFYFDHHPSESDIQAAVSIVRIERNIKMKGETFLCHMCYKERHWLDTDGTIEEKQREVFSRWYCAECEKEWRDSEVWCKPIKGVKNVNTFAAFTKKHFKS